MISVIIPTYKAPEALEICLDSVLSNQSNDNQIIVVVDGYYDLNKHILEKYNTRKYMQNVTVIIFDENRGLSAATNTGVYHALHDKILIVNDDNVFPPNWDNQLLESYKDRRVIAPNQIEPSPSIFKDFIIHPFGDPDNFDADGFYEFANMVSSDKITSSGSTLPIFMSKIDYLAVGGWDESYPGAWVVDWDFFYKCDLAGYEMVRSHKCHFYHFVSYGTEITEQEKKIKEERESECHRFFKFKWGWYPKKTKDNKLCKR